MCEVGSAQSRPTYLSVATLKGHTASFQDGVSHNTPVNMVLLV